MANILAEALWLVGMLEGAGKGRGRKLFVKASGCENIRKEVSAPNGFKRVSFPAGGQP